ncbi:hypothetical protein [Chitinophaga vietnamensis]|uniref:hypothetical protein n=1 Tax=Chitinophaga vietnamensis TaxID=2593957 RepID=UPI001178813A|nr:hypothetical protein [Chitinophaga vietnamensis]
MQQLQQEVLQLRRQMNYFRIYAIVSSVLIFAFIGFGFRKSQDDIVKSLRAEKIDIVEADGTVRLALFNSKNIPPAIVRGKKLSREGATGAGLMFYNTEGIECGGLTFSGKKGKDGNGESDLGMTLDKYNQDQTVKLAYEQQNGNEYKGLTVYDRADYPIDITMTTIDSIRAHIKDSAQQSKAFDKLIQEGVFGTVRMVAGQYNKRTGVFLRDNKGKLRLEMIVNDKNEPEILFYDENGTVHKKITY